MTKLKTLNNEEYDIINLLKDKELIVYEEIEGSTIFVLWNGKEFVIKPKSLRNEPLNFIDLATQKFYNLAHSYFNSLPDYVTDLLNKNWWFCFEFFPDNQPANTEYDHIPQNNLILKCIVKGSKFKYEYDEIEEYARLFKSDSLPVVFKGILSEEQLEKINLFLNTSEKDLNFVFGEKNFAKWFYDLLNPNLKSSYLMDDDFNNNIKKLIMKIKGDDEYSFQILNPSYERLSHNNTTEFVDIYSLILVNFMEFAQLLTLQKYKLKELTKDELYVELVCKIFNDYISDIKDDVINKWIIDIPPFFKDDKFKININFIKDQKTVNYIKSDPKVEYIFKCILGSFSKTKNKPIGVFNEQTLDFFNKLVNDIDNFLNNKLNINREHQFQRSDIKNFKDFYDLKYNTDSEDELYPDVYDLHDEIESDDKKGKKKKEVEFKKGDGKGDDFEIQKEIL